jgi:dolichol-phosphate mannosyltransferase
VSDHLSAAAADQGSYDGLSVVVPVYNEIELLDRQVRRLASFLAANLAEQEVIIVESGSFDGTAEVADGLARELPSVRVLHEQSRRGFGSAVRIGFSAARMPIVMVVPVDIPFPLDAIMSARPLLRDAECVWSYRSNDPRRWVRRVQSAAFNAVARQLLGVRPRSINSAFKLYRRELIERLPLRSDGWLIDAEILCWMTRLGTSIIEIPIDVIDRDAGTSKIGLRDIGRMFHGVFSLRREFRRSSSPCHKLATLR